jgi:hypothetical protein
MIIPMKKLIWICGALIIVLSCAVPKKTTENKTVQSPPDKITITIDTTKRTVAKLRPYKEVITAKAITRKGLFTVHKLDDRFLIEIPDSLLNTDILLVNRISKGPAAGRVRDIGFAGDQIGENVIQFAKGPNNKLFIKHISFQERSDDSTENGLYRSVLNSSLQPIVASFDIKTVSPDSSAVVIDITDYVNGDNSLLFFDVVFKKVLGLGMLQADKSYIQDISTFPLNLEVRTVKTYMKENQSFISYELNSSFVLLPREPMKPRYADARMGYFKVGYKDFDKPQGIKQTQMITRWRLEPKPQDVEKYKRGELVEPQKPIIFYIDPATPAKWVPYLIQGVNDWQVAFEKAGFKNAIYALKAPVNDSLWSLDDARHNAIVYKPSDNPNASGPHVHDPRTGEILETHVNWYHNVMQLLHDWYFIQAGPNDKRARTMEFDDSLMGQLIRFVSSHEIGHTLGLTHNFGASSTVPVDSLRNKNWVEKNGICPSIMDYARFDYVAQPGDGITATNLMPRIGDYDKWTIEWGYKWLPQLSSEKEERAYMNRWIIERTEHNKRLWFGSDISNGDPRCQSEDLGDDAIKASAYGIQNLKRIMTALPEWTKEQNEDYSNLTMMEAKLADQFRLYLLHVVNNVGGISFDHKTIEEQGNIISFTSKEKQKRAVQFLQEQLFTTPLWILDKNQFFHAGGSGIYQFTDLQSQILKSLVSQSNFTHLSWFQTYAPENAYSFEELLDDLEAGIWSELKQKKLIDVYRRNLQKVYAERLMMCLDYRKSDNPLDSFIGPSNVESDANSITRAHIKQLIKSIDDALPFYTDKLSKWHLEDVRNRLSIALTPPLANIEK